MPIRLKWSLIASRRKTPMSPYLTFPDASRSSRLRHEVLAGSFGHDDHRVAPAVRAAASARTGTARG